MTENDLIYLVFVSCVFLLTAIGFLISGIRFELGKITAASKREYIKRGTLRDGYVAPDLRGLLVRGRETHTPMGIGTLILYLTILLQFHFSGGYEDEGGFISWGFIVLGICFIIAMCRTMSKGTLMPRWARQSLKKQKKS
jgi:hypothetical protein